MFSIKCQICGKEFETNRSVNKYCSDTCRKQGLSIVRKQYYGKYRQTEAYHIYRNTYHKNNYHYVVKFCKCCGKKLNDARQTWCIDCLFDDYNKTHSKESFMRLTNRGYNKALIMEELRNRR